MRANVTSRNQTKKARGKERGRRHGVVFVARVRGGRGRVVVRDGIPVWLVCTGCGSVAGRTAAAPYALLRLSECGAKERGGGGGGATTGSRSGRGRGPRSAVYRVSRVVYAPRRGRGAGVHAHGTRAVRGTVRAHAASHVFLHSVWSGLKRVFVRGRRVARVENTQYPAATSGTAPATSAAASATLATAATTGSKGAHAAPSPRARTDCRTRT